MSVSTEVCRDIFDTRDVLKQQLATAIVEGALGTGLDKSQCKNLDAKVAGAVDTMFDRLVDRVAKKLESST